jgi:hypothetical protein
VIADVNGTAITEGDFLKKLKQSPQARDVLAKLIQDQILLDEIKKSNLDIPEAEVNKFYKQIWQQAGLPNEAAFLKAVQEQGGSKEMVLQEIRLQLAREKLLTKEAKVTPEEVKAYFEKHRERYDAPATVSLNFIVVNKKETADKVMKELGENRTWEDVAKETTLPGTPFTPQEFPTSVLASVTSPEIADAIKNLEQGAHTRPLPIAPTSQLLIGLGLTSDKQPYIIVRLVDRKKAEPAKLDALKDRVEQECRLEKALKSQLAKLNYDRESEGHKVQLLSLARQQGLQDLLRSLNQKATVIVRDPDLLSVEKMFGAPTAAVPGLPSDSSAPSPPALPAEGGEGGTKK